MPSTRCAESKSEEITELKFRKENDDVKWWNEGQGEKWIGQDMGHNKNWSRQWFSTPLTIASVASSASIMVTTWPSSISSMISDMPSLQPTQELSASTATLSTRHLQPFFKPSKVKITPDHFPNTLFTLMLEMKLSPWFLLNGPGKPLTLHVDISFPKITFIKSITTRSSGCTSTEELMTHGSGCSDFWDDDRSAWLSPTFWSGFSLY